jgi:hypothetical protein
VLTNTPESWELKKVDSLQGYKVKVAHQETGKVSSAFKDYVVSRDTKKPEPRKTRSLKSNPLRQGSDSPYSTTQLRTVPDDKGQIPVCDGQMHPRSNH